MDENTLSVPLSYDNQQERRIKIDLKSGAITMIPKHKGDDTLKCTMYMKVFKNTYEHHAQLYTDARYVKLYSVISLRNCHIEANEDEKTVQIRTFSKDQTLLMFEAENVTDVREWVKSLTPSDNLGINSEFSPQHSPAASTKVVHDFHK